MTGAEVPTTRTYGNWRRESGFGIGRLGPAQTMTVFGAVLVPIFCVYISPSVALFVAVVAVLVLAAVLVRVGGQSLADVVTRSVRFTRARHAGWTELSGGMLTDHPRKHDLPGPLAPLVPLNVDDGRGGKQGLLWDRRTGWLTAVIRVSPVGLDLADRSQADAWVAAWGAWLADLGYQHLVRHIAVTVDTAPSGGTTLQDYVTERIDPRAPETARSVMSELVASTPTTIADVDTRVSITFDPTRAVPRPADLLGAVTEVTRWLPGMESSLAMAGVAVLGRATVEWLTGRLRIAFDPASRPDVARARNGAGSDLLLWSEAGPVRAQESWESWRHDSGISVAWALSEAPRQAVVDRVLTPLLAPGPFPRRVTLLYEPYSAGTAATEVEREITNTQVRRAFAQRTRRDETQRERDDFARALQSAREEAEGAGVGKFCLYVSTTVGAEELLPAATADVEQRAGQSKLRLRRLRGAQAAGFAAALGVGLNPAELARRAFR
ncbi:hypothetical protein Psed_6902 (plasmid) [Pseudonocardia dioxanivorans CB1190]|uniref:Integral membrane protein n=1 Tax=Pseudonocardia dioxanivorans (strain ATCC 55486 / DSM 44775 / JCM 13855 / CB1190) TaxID=675635 RepID=F2L6Z7_PSEUX|nr:SCO6880 family protein [Pseudonocardia dioxanivorans]AEA28970.1 hypothetical protein Psed_6902 [Pseudonocardia dioxanivorans CB1190]